MQLVEAGYNRPVLARGDHPRHRAGGTAPRPLRVIIAGGYTSGHVHCALAIAAGLERARPGAEVRLAGARGGMEVGAAAAAGYPIDTVWIGALDRRRILGNLWLPVQLAVSQLQALTILRRVRPHAVVGVGGYASAPMVLAAQIAGIPTLLHEANALPGVANRLLARHARVICLGVEAAADHFPDGRTVVTGTPVYARSWPRPTAAARSHFGIEPERTTLFVTGGSLGSAALNHWVTRHAEALVGAGLQILWQTGPAHLAQAVARPQLHPVPFIDDMAAAYAAADLVVCGAGALTLAELAHLGKAAVIVPARDVTEDHQSRNAAELERLGLAICPDPAALLALVLELVANPARRTDLGIRMAQLARPEATERIVAQIARLCDTEGAT